MQLDDNVFYEEIRTTMKAQPFVVSPKDYDPALNVLGIQVTVLASNAKTQAYEITRQQGEKGMGAPPHSHNWDESFYVIAGEIEFTCSGKTVLCQPGTLVHVPAGTVHSFATLPIAAMFSRSLARAAWLRRCLRPLAKKFLLVRRNFRNC